MPWCRQSASLVSLPMQNTLSRKMGPSPCPYVAKCRAMAPENQTYFLHLWCWIQTLGLSDGVKFSPTELSPSCLQTTAASLLSQESSHTVPQIPLKQISTVPDVPFSDTLPPTSLMSVSLHSAKCPKCRNNSKFIMLSVKNGLKLWITSSRCPS